VVDRPRGDSAAPSAGKSPLTPARVARQLLASAVGLPRREMVSLDQAPGRVLAGPLVAGEDVPGHARAMVDGYGVRAVDIAAASVAAPVNLRVVGQVAPGREPPFAVGAGQAAAVPTGGQLPDGVDAVVMVEDVTVPDDDHGQVVIRAPLPAGRNLLGPGGDVRAGSEVLPAGRRLGPRDIAALALFGVSGVAVTAAPRVAVLSSGAELRPAGEARQGAQVRDLNQPALAAAAEAAGAVVTRAGIVTDDPGLLASKLRELAADHDLVITSGGSSVGIRDFAEEAVLGAGGTILFHGLDVRPGRPVLAARLGSALVVGLPGVPAAALTLFQVFLRPLLALLRGEAPGGQSPWRARLAAPVASRAGREDYLRVRLEVRGAAEGSSAGELWALPLAGGPALLSTLFAADALMVVPEDRAALAAGDPVELVPLT
jgi:molybdopterin molybdotransferase